MDTRIDIIKTLHEGLYDSVKGKKLKLSPEQKRVLNSTKRITFYKGR